jgi:cephalosporin hydroxylase
MILLKILKAKFNRFTHPKKDIFDKFHSKYYYSKIWAETYWMGKHVFKCPLDLWVYQEMIFELKPELIIETGTFHGGSALFFANLFDIIGIGQVITIDVDKMSDMPVHKRIIYLEGSSLSGKVIGKIKEYAAGKTNILVFLDSDHKCDHVLKELEIYSKFVSKGNYIVVEDSNLNGHPVYSGFGQGPGPMEAIEKFMEDNREFEIDKSKEKFLLTFNPNGFLKRII